MLDLFVPLTPDRFVAESDGVVVVDKPAGMVCVGAPRSMGGDLVTRVALARALDKVSCPAPLDTACSGLLPFATNKDAARELAASVAETSPTRTWLAVVRGDDLRDTTLSHRVIKGRGGITAEPARDKAATAVTELEVRGRGPGVALVELRIRRGKPAQLRAQLAAAGAAIAGDRERGGPAARRLMLHSATVEVPRLAGVTTSRVAELEEFLATGADFPPADRSSLARRLSEAASARWALATGRCDEGRTDVFRLADGAGDGVPGLALDLYGEHLVAHLYPDALRLPEEDVLDVLGELGAAGVYVKRRPAQANELVDTRRDDVAPAHALRGVDAEPELVVHEGGVPYRVRLGDGLSTGIFLDQRENRARVREWANGASVLNLFSYTCPFTVAAAVGGATRTRSVDASAAALDWGRRNVADAAGAGEHEFVHTDVFEDLDELARRGDGFDLVIVDPPTYSTTKGTRWTSRRAWRDLAARCLRVAKSGGRLLCCSNDRRLSERKLVSHLQEALADAGRSGTVRTHAPPADFRPPPGGEPHLKSVVVELD